MKNKAIRESLYTSIEEPKNIQILNHFNHLNEVRKMASTQHKVRWRPTKTFDGRFEFIENNRLFRINSTLGVRNKNYKLLTQLKSKNEGWNPHCLEDTKANFWFTRASLEPMRRSALVSNNYSSLKM